MSRLVFFLALSLTAASARAQTASSERDGAVCMPDVHRDVQAATLASARSELAGAPFLASFPQGDGRKGTVKIVRGDVTLESGQTRHAVVEGEAVRQGDRIVAGAHGIAAIALRDGTVVSVGPDSAVVLTQYRFEPTTEDGGIVLSLLRGSLRVVTGLITRATSESEPARVKVVTPTAVIGVRGTDVVVDASS